MNTLTKDFTCKNEKNIFITISCVVWGLIAHGVALFNKFSFNDDAFFLYDVGYTYNLGRWALGFLAKIVKIIFGTTHYSTPLFNGILTLLFISIIAYIIIDYFSFNNRLNVIAITGILICFPAITGIMGFMFTAPYYYFALMIGVIGQLALFKSDKWYSFVFAILCLTISTGVYQANIPFHLSLFLLDMIKTVDEFNGETKVFISIGLKYIFVSVSFLALYLVVNSTVLQLKDLQLFSDRRGVDNFGLTSVVGYIERILLSYIEFFDPKNNHSRNMFPFSSLYIYIGLYILVFVSMFIYLRSKINNKLVFFQQLFLFILIPLITNFIFVMVDDNGIHGLMTYGKSMFFIIALWLFKKTNNKYCLMTIGISLVIVLNIMYVRFSNICYLKASLQQSQTISYFNTLITQIKSTEGYKNDSPVVYVNEFHINDSSFVVLDEFEAFYLHPYRYKNLLNNYAWKEFMKNWCGFNPTVINQDVFGHYSEIDSMPSYPNDGSIKMIDDVVVIKFSD